MGEEGSWGFAFGGDFVRSNLSRAMPTLVAALAKMGRRESFHHERSVELGAPRVGVALEAVAEAELDAAAVVGGVGNAEVG